MKVALIADRDWLAQEQPTLRRLVVGLVDEGARVVRVEPEGSETPDEKSLITAERVTYRSARWLWTRDWHLRSLQQVLTDADVDVLHALDGTLAFVTARLGKQMDVPTVCSIWSADEVERLPPQDVEGVSCYTAASLPLVEATVRQVRKDTPVTCVPPGVYASVTTPVPPLARIGNSLCCIVVGNGRFDIHYRELLKAIASTRSRLAGAMFFFAGEGDQHGLWRAAEDMGLLECVSLMPTGADARSLFMQADVLIQPQPLLAVRTAVLEALAAGRPLLAAADPMVGYLIDGTTARLIDAPDELRWTACLEELVRSPEDFVRLGQSASRYVISNFGVAAFVTRMGQIYEEAASPALPFS